MNVKTISEGMTNAYLIQGVCLLVLGGAAFSISAFIALPVLILAVGTFASITGVQINSEKKQYRKFVSIFSVQIGTWQSYSKSKEIILVLSTERKTIRGIIPGAIPIGRSSTIQVRTYDVLMNDGIKSEEVNDFLTYKNALLAFNGLTSSLKIAGRNFVEEKLASNRAKRSR